MTSRQYQIELVPAAQRQLKKLPLQVQKHIIKKLDKLIDEPRPDGVKKLIGMDDLYRIRIGSYRVIYKINDKQSIILIVKVGDRKDIYCD